MDYSQRINEAYDYAGMSTGINQANNTQAQDTNTFSAISMINNQNMRDYKDQILAGQQELEASKRENLAKIKETQEKAVEKVGEYGTAISEKYSEYKDFLKEGGNIADLRSYQFAQGVGGAFKNVGQAGKGVYNNIKSTNIQPRQAFINEGSIGEEPFQNENNRPNQTNEPQPEPTDDEQSTTNQTGSNQSDEIAESSGNSGENANEELDAGQDLEEGEEEVGKVGKISKGVAKVGGALFSATTLGSDIYDQVKSKSFFYGENAGDKTGNFMNELGSGADLLGVATGDPLLVMAGVGLGAVGGLVSDISELFGHHKAEPKPPPPPPPPKIVQAPAQINLAGTGGVVQSQPSTLRSIQQGA